MQDSVDMQSETKVCQLGSLQNEALLRKWELEATSLEDKEKYKDSALLCRYILHKIIKYHIFFVNLF